MLEMATKTAGLFAARPPKLISRVIRVVVSVAVFFWGGMMQMTADWVVRAFNLIGAGCRNNLCYFASSTVAIKCRAVCRVVKGAILRTGSSRSLYRGVPAPRVRDESKGGAARAANQQSIAGADQTWRSKSKKSHVDASHFFGSDRTDASPQWPLHTSLNHQLGEPR